MKWVYKILRTFLVSTLIVGVALPCVLFIALSLPPVKEHIRQRAETELTTLLGSEVSIGYLDVVPFNQVRLSNVSVTDPMDADTKALKVKDLGAGVDMWRLLKGELVFTYAEVVGLDGKLWRQTPSSPLNIQPIIDKLSPKDKNKPPTQFDLAIKNVVIRNSSLSYDILSEPVLVQGRFNTAHIKIDGLMADVSLPRLKNDNFDIDIRRMALHESSGLCLRNLTTVLKIRKQNLTVEKLAIEMPSTVLEFDGQLFWPYKSLQQFAEDWRTTPIRLSLKPGARITPSDFKAFEPRLAEYTNPVEFALDVNGTANSFEVNRLGLETEGLRFEVAGNVSDALSGFENLYADVARFDIEASNAFINKIITSASPNVNAKILSALGDVKLTALGKLQRQQTTFDATLQSGVGDVKLTGQYSLNSRDLETHIDAQNLYTQAFGDFPVSITDMVADISVQNIGGHIENASFDGAIGGFTYKGYTYAPITAVATLADKVLDADVNIDDPNVLLHLVGTYNFASDAPAVHGSVDLHNFNPTALNLTNKFKYIVDGSLMADVENLNADLPVGNINFTNLKFNALTTDGKSLDLGDIAITSQHDDAGYNMLVDSRAAQLRVNGDFNLKTLPKTLRWMAASVAPNLFPEEYGIRPENNDFVKVDLNVPNEDNPLLNFLSLPIEPLVPVKLTAEIDGANGDGKVDFNIPYLRQGKKLIENTAVTFDLNALQGTSQLYANTIFTAKGERVNLTIENNNIDAKHDTEVSWRGENGRNHGDFRCSTSFRQDSTLVTDIKVNPGKIVFADTVWTIAPSTITIRPKQITVDNFRVWREAQLLSINGSVSPYPDDELIVTLRDINLDYVFETLNISSNVMFGGDATGSIHASGLFGSKPVAYTDDLFVKGLAYNHCVMGDGHIKSHLIPENWGIVIDAEIEQANGYHSIINGIIKPKTEELDFRFNANHAPVGFLQPFMAAFCNKVTGEASGDAHLFGTFALLDMQGKIIAHDVAMDIDFTGTTYHATDTVTINPGRIELKDITLHDDYGNTALLSGFLTHNAFHDPVFQFNITKARDFLCYDVKQNNEHPWYGRIFGNGSASISGKPGIVNINVNMSTAAKSEFTFILSDEEIAAEYNFLTFRDKTPISERHEVKVEKDTIPAAVRQMREKLKRMQAPVSPTDYSMTFNIDITPQAEITLVMDPVGGDKIRATGTGNMLMTYDAASDDLKMYGTYTLDRGRYNFTLQDIIVKEFTIDQGSSIAFHGDPYNAQLDIKAYYQLNANLTDLDESFAQDRDLNRTNVPVRAMLYATGDMRSPDLAFDIQFPTLAPETSRKVRSIVSTDEMMSQQIIYLLALNRFYTPDYMTATRGNELVSVASSTLSSRLSSMLGELSDKFSIAPTVRSDRGDFSDVEVDVALSSSLLNNRLLLNGTLGYRDNTLNTNQFIGDFDVEYLLNRTGTIRLKAYNRYNDRNYYLKTALTTQGVGVEFKREFDDFSSALKSLFRKNKSTVTTPETTTPAVNTDSVPLLIMRPSNADATGND